MKIYKEIKNSKIQKIWLDKFEKKYKKIQKTQLEKIKNDIKNSKIQKIWLDKFEEKYKKIQKTQLEKIKSEWEINLENMIYYIEVLNKKPKKTSECKNEILLYEWFCKQKEDYNIKKMKNENLEKWNKLIKKYPILLI